MHVSDTMHDWLISDYRVNSNKTNDDKSYNVQFNFTLYEDSSLK